MLSLTQAQNALLSLGPEKTLSKYGMSTRAVVAQEDGNSLHIKLLDEMSDAVRTPFPPSVFGGGEPKEGERLGLAVVVPQSVADSFLQLEAKVLDLLRKEHPKIDKMWCSAVKDSSTLPPLLKTKIQLSGPRSTVFFDEKMNPTGPPTDWKGVALNICFVVRGVYIRKDSAGLQLDTTHVQHKPRMVPSPSILNPFA
jgi:hypothetical protein